MLPGFTILHLRFSLQISNRNITYKSYGQHPAESFMCAARHEPLTQKWLNMDFGYREYFKKCS